MNVVALTSFLCDVEGAQSVGILVGFLFGLVCGAWNVEESIGASGLTVLAGGGPSSSGRLPPNLRRSFRFG